MGNLRRVCWSSWGVAATSIAAVGGVLGIVYYLRPLPDLLAQATETRSQSTLGALAATGLLLVVVVVLSLAPGLAWALARP